METIIIKFQSIATTRECGIKYERPKMRQGYGILRCALDRNIMIEAGVPMLKDLDEIETSLSTALLDQEILEVVKQLSALKAPRPNTIF